MKDITHYLSNSSKTCEKTSNKVNEKRAKLASNDTTEEIQSSKKKKKRGREKIKILHESGQSTTCNTIENSSHSTDQTLEPCLKIKAKSKTSRNKIQDKTTENCQNVNTNTFSRSSEGELEQNNLICNLNSKKVDNIQEIELSDKQEHLKNDEMEKKETNKINLLHYFGKVTPEQLEKQKLLKARVVVNAEIHHLPQNPLTMRNNNRELEKCSVKQKSGIKLGNTTKEDFDEIHVIQSNTLIPSPTKIEKMQFPSSQNKLKWSMKIQLESQKTTYSSKTDTGCDEIYSPTDKAMSIRENKKIPKVLMPIKNRNKKLVDIEKDTVVAGQQTEENEKSKTDYQYLSVKTTNNLRKESEDYQIVQDYSSKRKPKEKLAPLFVKKSKPNSEIVTVQHPPLIQLDEKEKNEDKVLKLCSTEFESFSSFPKIGHVNHFVSQSNTSKSCFLPFKSIENFQEGIHASDFNKVIELSNCESYSENCYEFIPAEIDATRSEIESQCSSATTLWDHISGLNKYKKNTKRTPTMRSVKKPSGRKNSKFCHDDENKRCEQNNNLWTDKYKPSSCKQIVGNEEAATKFRTWLDSWKNLEDHDNYSSSEEFYTSDCSASSYTSNNQVAVLIGPHGSGKTSCVYAVSQELGYKVLEVNASSRRPGKIILRELEEATKSHRVKKSHLKDFCNSQKERSRILQRSLILLEDVDLVFEEDDGFIHAISQLASSTKIPIAMTLKGPCFHLSKLAPQQLRIDFQPVCGNRALALLQLIALAEMEWKLDPNYLEDLCQTGDLRKCLLQLQYLVLSDKKSFPRSACLMGDLSWQNVRTNIYCPAMRADKETQKLKKCRNDKSILNELVKSIDNFSIISEILDIRDPTCCQTDANFEPSLSPVQNVAFYSSLGNISSEIGNWMNETIQSHWSISSEKKETSAKYIINQPVYIENQINNSISTALSQMVSNTLDRNILAVDYLPSIRTVCRAEEFRSRLNSKRGNRFFHYFQSSKLSSSTMKSSNFLSIACKTLQEETESSIKT